MHGSAGLPRFEQPRGAASHAARAARIAARPTHCAARAPAEDGQTRAVHPSASFSPPAPPPVPIVSYTGDSLLERELAVHAAGLRAPAIRASPAASAPAPIVPKKPFRIDPLNREPGTFPEPEPRRVHRIHQPAHIRESARRAAHAEPAPQAKNLCRG